MSLNAARVLLTCLAFNVLGLAGLVDGFVEWGGIFAKFIVLYDHLIRSSLKWIVELMYPADWPRIPNWVYDATFVWLSFGVGCQVLTLTARDITRVFVHDQPGRRVCLFLYGPLGLLSFIKDVWTSRAINEEIAASAKLNKLVLTATAWYFGSFGIVAVLLFLNFLLRQ